MGLIVNVPGEGFLLSLHLLLSITCVAVVFRLYYLYVLFLYGRPVPWEGRKEANDGVHGVNSMTINYIKP